MGTKRDPLLFHQSPITTIEWKGSLNLVPRQPVCPFFYLRVMARKSVARIDFEAKIFFALLPSE